MMSLVATPVVAARVAAPKKVRTQTVAKASSADQAKSSAVAGALALTMLAQPALAMNELGQIADKQADAKALAAAQFAELQTKKKAPTPEKKTKNLAAGVPSFSLPSFSAPSVGGGSKSAPAVKAAPKAPVEKLEVRHVHGSLVFLIASANAVARAHAPARARYPLATTTSRAIATRIFRSPRARSRSRAFPFSPSARLALTASLVSSRLTTTGPGQARPRDGHPVLPPARGRGSVPADAPSRGSPGGGGQGLLPQGHHGLLSRPRETAGRTPPRAGSSSRDDERHADRVGEAAVDRPRGGALRRVRPSAKGSEHAARDV